MFVEALFVVSLLLLDFILCIHLVECFSRAFSVYKGNKTFKEEKEETGNNIIEDSVFTTHELAEVERFRQRMEALRRDRDGLYDVIDTPITTFTGVEASE